MGGAACPWADAPERREAEVKPPLAAPAEALLE